MRGNYNLAVIGGGPGGYVAAIKAAQFGLKVALFEKDSLGGTCLNKGCIPTKTMLKSVKILDTLKKASGYAVDGVEPNKLQININALQERKKQIVTQLVGGVGSLLRANGVTVIKGKARFAEPGTIKVGTDIYQAKDVIIATGSKANSIPIPGIESAHVITSDGALAISEIPENIVILGGGVIGVEFALIFDGMGTKVTLVEMLERLLPTIDEEIAAEITKTMEQKGIKVFTGARAKAIKDDTLIFEKSGQEQKVSGEKILVAAGRMAQTEGIDIAKLGIKLGGKAIITNETMATNIPNIYAIGDVNGKLMLAHKASAEALVAVKNIVGQVSRMDYQTVPQCIYSFPEISSVGLTEIEARREYGDIKVGRFPFTANGKALVEGETSGFIKVVADNADKTILGVHIIGPLATELISEAVVAMRLECTADELAECIHPHPTVAEALMETFQDTTHKAIHYYHK